MIDRDSTLWMMTNTKIFRMVSDAFTEYNEDDGLVFNPWALAADPAGGLWIGSITRELQYFDGERFINQNVPDALFHGTAGIFPGQYHPFKRRGMDLYQLGCAYPGQENNSGDWIRSPTIYRYASFMKTLSTKQFSSEPTEDYTISTERR